MHNKTEQPYKYILKPLEKGPNHHTNVDGGYSWFFLDIEGTLTAGVDVLRNRLSIWRARRTISSSWEVTIYGTSTSTEFLLHASTKIDAITKELDRRIEEFHAREK